jgi:hypothetical protein
LNQVKNLLFLVIKSPAYLLYLLDELMEGLLLLSPLPVVRQLELVLHFLQALVIHCGISLFQGVFKLQMPLGNGLYLLRSNDLLIF